MPVQLEMKDQVALVTLDRPDALNALNTELLLGLRERVDEAIERGARCIVVTGAGKAFVAGADIADMAPLGVEEAHAYSASGHELLDHLASLPVPTIAAVNGFALGGGTELALALDIRVASEKAVFGLPEVTLGVIPGFGGTQRLPRLIGLGPALDIILTGRKVTADEALRLGLVTHVVAPDDVVATAIELGERIAAAGPVAVAKARETTHRGFDAPLADGDALEVEAFGACFGTEDQKEGMRAFLEKRTPSYKGR